MIRVLAPLLLALALAAPAYATSVVYTDRAAWEAAVTGSIYTETFDSLTAQTIPSFVGGTLYTPGFDIVIPQGAVLTTFIGAIPEGLVLTSMAGMIFKGDAEGEGGGEPGWNDFVFHAPIVAFGADVWIERPPSGVGVQIAGEVLPMYMGFFGLIADAPFSTMRIDGNHMSYILDNVGTVTAPEPSSAALVVLVVVASRRRLRKGADFRR